MNNIAPLKNLYLYKYKITLLANKLILLPAYKGSAIRGVFGYIMKKVVCIVKDSNCEGCMLRLKCIYSAIMGSSVSEDYPNYRKYRIPPHPYIIVPPLTRKRYFKKGEDFSFEIVLIGRMNDYLPYFVFAFTEMGKRGIGRERGKFEVVRVDAIHRDGTIKEVFQGSTGTLKSSDNKISYQEFIDIGFGDNELHLVFETPVRMKRNDRLVPDIPFHLLISRLSERAFLLAHFHCGAEPGDFEGFVKGSENVETISNKLRWMDWERYSNKQQVRMKFGGLVGEITYGGDFQKYFPLIRLGEYIHVGKATTFGLGKYRIIKFRISDFRL